MKKIRNLIVIFMAVLLIFPSFVGAERSTSYTDLKPDDSHYEDIMQLTEQGFLSGYPNADNTRSFRSNEPISRVHVAVILENVFQLEPPRDLRQTLQQFSDVNVNHPHATAIAASYEAGFFKGNNGRFLVNANITREQMASVLVKAFQLNIQGREKINLQNVHPSHRSSVQALADYGFTNQLQNYRPQGFVTRGQFATFIMRGLFVNPDETEDNYAREILNIVNQERIRRGLSGLTLDNQLSYAAKKIAEDIVDHNYFAHTSPVYGTLQQKMEYFNINYYLAGENLAKGYPNATAVVRGWMQSPGHRENILESRYTHLGVGYDARRNVWVQLFVGR